MINSQQVQEPTFGHAVFLLISIMIVVGVGLFGLQTSLHSLLIICILIAGCSAVWLGYRMAEIRQAMNSAVTEALPALYIFILIGVLIAALIQSGTLTTLVYYGVAFINPLIFLPAAMMLCSLMSLATGTSWGTVGTVGVVLMGIGQAMTIPAPLVAGAVISGACFGDKMSPMSDTTNLAAMSAKTNLYDHIGSVFMTTGPTYVLVLLVFSCLGLSYVGQGVPGTGTQRLAVSY